MKRFIFIVILLSIGASLFAGDLQFSRENVRKIATGGAYPRLYALKDGSWLLGYDDGRIHVRRSNDKGRTWSEPSIASFHDEALCANVDFHELPDGTILCSYRAIGKAPLSPYSRGIFCSVSHDKGATWQEYNTIVSNFALGLGEQKIIETMSKGYDIGFYEPFVDVINGVVTVMYSDDFSPMLENVRQNPRANHRCQRIVAKELINGVWTNQRIIMDGAKEKTVGGITRISRDGMSVFTRMKSGEYVVVFEGMYRNQPETDSIPFVVLMAYSMDGVNWSAPIEVYVPKGHGTKAAAPYVCVTDDNRLVVSFQTDEDCFAATGKVGDGVSVMKCVISDGTPIQKMDRTHFCPAQDVFFLKPGNAGLWNGMMYHEGILYCVSGLHDGIHINSCTIPPIAK